MYEYNATCLRVVDGDTLDLDIDLGLRIHTRQRVRLHGIDTPEIHGVPRGSDEHKAGMRAKEYVEGMLLDKPCMVHTFKDRTGKYGRYLAIVALESGEIINDMLVAEGHAVRRE